MMQAREWKLERERERRVWETVQVEKMIRLRVSHLPSLMNEWTNQIESMSVHQTDRTFAFGKPKRRLTQRWMMMNESVSNLLAPPFFTTHPLILTIHVWLSRPNTFHMFTSLFTFLCHGFVSQSTLSFFVTSSVTLLFEYEIKRGE